MPPALDFYGWTASSARYCRRPTDPPDLTIVNVTAVERLTILGMARRATDIEAVALSIN